MAYSKQNFQNGQILNAANLEKMENGIIAGQGAENLLDNSNFRDPVNSRGKNTYSDAGNEYTIDRWKTQSGTNISIENGYINIIGQWELYQIIQNPKDGIYTFAARIRINSIGQFTPIMEVNNGSNTGRQINLDADIGEWKTYILQYDLSSMTAETIKFLLSPRGGNTTASISVEWAAMYKGAYTANTLPAYVPKGKHVEMLNCGVSLQPHNLFDNSDFRNPVNSRGITSTEASGYHIDRWKKENESGKVIVGNGYLSMTGTGAYWFLTQYIEPKKIKSGAVYTIALADTSGSISICSTVMSTNMTKFTARHTFTSGAVVITNVEYASDKYSIYFTSNSSKETRFAWAVLYEGFYTADTLPTYVPKGKHVEMLNCGVPLQPRNLLDNSDFRNPVNQRGAASYTGNVYTIDRWKLSANTLNIGSDGITLVAGDSFSAELTQYISGLRDGVYTQASNVNGTIYTRIIQLSGSTTMTIDGSNAEYTGGYVSCAVDSSGYFCFLIHANAGYSITVRWAALYEGSYTADTLPPYVPKGKHVEMLNCGIPLAPHNLLDNSDFRNPVNQRGATTTSQYKYFLDRWIARLSDISLAVGNSGLTLTSSETANIFIYQKLSAGKALNGKTVTVAVCDGTGNVATTTTNLPTTNATSWTSYAVAQTNNGVYASVIDLGSGDYPIAVRVGVASDASNKTIRWAALYEGAYDASTLPAYQPKGYAAELAECMRYYYQTWDGAKLSSGAKIPGIQIRNAIAASRLVNVEFPVAMRITPTITLYTSDFIEGAVRNWNNSSDTVTGVIAVYGSTKGFVPGKEASDFTNGAPYSFHYSASADL